MKSSTIENIVIRRAEPEDAPAMAACVTAAYGHYSERIGRPPGPMFDDYLRVINEDLAFVADSKGRLIGLMVLKFNQGKALLDNVAVYPDCQGTGLGRRLIGLAEAETKKAGFASLELYTNEKMIENIRFYKKLGYMETGRCPGKRLPPEST